VNRPADSSSFSPGASELGFECGKSVIVGFLRSNRPSHARFDARTRAHHVNALFPA
jgi:hypothetical protein